MTQFSTRAAAAVALLAVSAGGLPAAAADQPELPTEPLTVTCADLGIPESYCDAEKVSEADVLQAVLNGPIVQALMAPLMQEGVFGPPGATPPPPEMEPTPAGEMPKMFQPVFDTETYRTMMQGGVTRNLVVEDLGMELAIPVIDCRYAICLPSWMSGGAAFVDWEEVEMPEMPVMEPMSEAPEAEAEEAAE